MHKYMIEMIISYELMINSYTLPDENSRVDPVVGIEDGMDVGTTVKNLWSSNISTIKATHSFLDSHSDPALNKFMV